MRTSTLSRKYLLLLSFLVIFWGILTWVESLNLAAILNEKTIDSVAISSDIYSWHVPVALQPGWCLSISEQDGCEAGDPVRTEIISAVQTPGDSRYINTLPVPITDHRPYIVHVRFTDQQVLVLTSFESSPDGIFYGKFENGGQWPGRLLFKLFRYENPRLQAVLDRLER